MFFQEKVNLRSRDSMLAFLKGHYRYYTMSSWNKSTSYANCVKVHRLGLTAEQRDRAYEVLDMPEVADMREAVVDDFTEQHGGAYTIGVNGRSGGYLVLYSSYYEETKHKSRCRSCGQLNFKRVYEGEREGARGVIAAELMRSACSWRTSAYLEQSAIRALGLSDQQVTALVDELRPACQDATLDNQCGHCHAQGAAGRVNLAQPVRTLQCFGGRSIDQSLDDLAAASIEALRERVRLVTSFDAACDAIRDGFIQLLDNYDIVEDVVMVPKTVRHLELRPA